MSGRGGGVRGDCLGWDLIFYPPGTGPRLEVRGSGSQRSGTGPRLEGRSWTFSWNGFDDGRVPGTFSSVLGRDRNTKGVGILSWDGICEDLTGLELDCQGSRGFTHFTYYWRLEGKTKDVGMRNSYLLNTTLCTPV